MQNLQDDICGIDIKYFRSVPLVDKGHDHSLLSALHQQQKSGNLCDVALVIENERFSAHKAVLAAFSSYFHALFENGQQNDEAKSKACNVKEIILSSVKKSTFLVILNYIYTSNLHIFKENFNDILRTSRKLQISGIVELCNKVIEDGIILPMFSATEQLNDNAEMESKNETSNKVLYVDLNECDVEDGSIAVTKETAHASPLRKNQETNAVSTNRQTSKSHLGFEKLPDTHSNGWPMRSREATSSLFGSSIVNHERDDQYPASKSLQISHPVVKEFTCSHCEKPFTKKANLQRHVLIKHSTGHRYSCPKCGRTYAIEQSLRYHISTSDCTKPSISSIHDEHSNLSGTGNILPALIHPSPSASYHQLQNTNPSMNLTMSSLEAQSYMHNNMKAHFSNPELQQTSGFLPQSSLVSTSVDDAMSFNIPTTTLFPSIANLDVPTGFDRLDTSNIDGSFYKFTHDTSAYQHFSHSNPVSEQNTNSDDDMPTISRVESIRQPFPSDHAIEVDPEDEAESAVTISRTSPSLSNAEEQQPDSTSMNIQQQTMTTVVNSAPSSPAEHDSSEAVTEHPFQQCNDIQDHVQNPVDISPFAGLLTLSNKVESNKYQYILPATSSSTSAKETNHIPSTSGPRVNFDENVHVCSTCEKSFSSLVDYDHHRKKCCKCPFCHRLFSEYTNMKRHVKIFHSGQKPHKCRICGQAYGIKQSMRAHMLRKHGIPLVTRKYQYKNCNKKSA